MNTLLGREVISNSLDIGKLIRQGKIESAILELNACAAFQRLIEDEKNRRVIPVRNPILDRDKRYFARRSGRIRMSLGGRGLNKGNIEMLSGLPNDQLWPVVHSLFA